jgi:hypothetical protein
MLSPISLSVGLLSPLPDAACRRLRNLSVEIALWRQIGTFPMMPQLERLQLHLKGKRVAPFIPIIDFKLCPKLQELWVEGTSWSGISEIFTGEISTMTVCCLKGPIVITTRLRDFFDRIASGLCYLYCHGTHLVGTVGTHFPALRHLSIHKVMAASPVFPFSNCANLTSLALEGDDIYTSTASFNRLLQDALRCTGHTIKGLTLRSGPPHLLEPLSIHSLLRSSQVQYILLDGAFILDVRDKAIIYKALNLKSMVHVPSWLSIQVILPFHRGRMLMASEL